MAVNTYTRTGLIAFTAMFFQMSPLNAMETGDWIVRVGVHNINPKSNNSVVVNVDDATQLTFNFTYMFKDNWGVEVLAAAPFEHDIKLLDGSPVATTKHLPPTVSLQYHFGTGTLKPYIGAGINYTLFFKQSTSGALAGAVLDLDESWGFASQIGFDYFIGDRMLLNVDVRYIDIDSDATLNGAALTTVSIDPLLFGISIGWHF